MSYERPFHRYCEFCGTPQITEEDGEWFTFIGCQCPWLKPGIHYCRRRLRKRDVVIVENAESTHHLRGAWDMAEQTEPSTITFSPSDPRRHSRGLEQGRTSGTPEELRAEVERLNRYIHDLEARGGIPEVVQENAALRENDRAKTAAIHDLGEEVERLHALRAEVDEMSPEAKPKPTDPGWYLVDSPESGVQVVLVRRSGGNLWVFGPNEPQRGRLLSLWDSQAEWDRVDDPVATVENLRQLKRDVFQSSSLGDVVQVLRECAWCLPETKTWEATYAGILQYLQNIVTHGSLLKHKLEYGEENRNSEIGRFGKNDIILIPPENEPVLKTLREIAATYDEPCLFSNAADELERLLELIREGRYAALAMTNLFLPARANPGELLSAERINGTAEQLHDWYVKTRPEDRTDRTEEHGPKPKAPEGHVRRPLAWDPKIPDDMIMTPRRVFVGITESGFYFGEVGKDGEPHDTDLTSRVLDPIGKRVAKGEIEGTETIDGVPYEFVAKIAEKEPK